MSRKGTFYGSIALLYCILVSTANSDTTNSDSQIIRGLFEILSSSSQGEASINVDAEPSAEIRSEHSVTDNQTSGTSQSSSSSSTTSTTEAINEYDDNDYSGELELMELPEPERLVPQNQIIKARLMRERVLAESHDEAKDIRREQVKSVLLRKLRLIRLPRPGMANIQRRFPHHILQGMDNEGLQMDEPEKEDDFHAKIDQMLRFSQEVPPEKSVRIPSDMLDSTMYFPMPFSLTEPGLQRATLLIYIDTPAGYADQKVTLNVLSNTWSKMIVSRVVTLVSGGHWEHIDITDISKTWLKHEWENNLGLVAQAEISGIDLINYNNNHSATNISFERLPLVKLEINEEYNNRDKRSANSDMPLACAPEDNEERCCRYPFVLDFDELGPDFDFIISPKRYWANYCKGLCPEYVLPNNANVQLTRGAHKSQRCCSPSGVASLKLIYRNDFGDVLRGVISGMSISSCGCD